MVEEGQESGKGQEKLGVLKMGDPWWSPVVTMGFNSKMDYMIG